VSSEASTRPPRGGGQDPGTRVCGRGVMPLPKVPLSNLERALARERKVYKYWHDLRRFITIVQFCEVAMAFKRKRVFAPRRSSGKRRRNAGYRRRRSTRTRSNGYTSRTSNARTSMSMFRRKPFSARRFRSGLFNETRFKSHYRSLATISVGRTTGVSATDSNVFTNFALNNAVAFWTAAGGARPIDNGVAVPPFSSDITIRGGIVNFDLQNTEPEQDGSVSSPCLKVKFWYIYTVGNVDLTIIPLAENNLWDPTTTSEFRQKVGQVYHYEEVILKPGEAYSFSRRLRASKLDQNRFLAFDHTPLFMYQVVSMDANPAFYHVKHGWNLSFSADAF